jgi:energy-converting hydrogenase B subunit J
LGIKINAKLNLLFYVVVGVGVAYLLGAFPYYELPMSFSFLLSLGGLLIGALINRIFKK